MTITKTKAADSVEFDIETAKFVEFFDELPLWSAPFALQILETVPVCANQTVLDIGCGTGFLSIELAQRAGAASKVIAIDPWRAAMERLERKIQWYGINNIELRVSDAAKSGLGDGIADLAISNLGINNFADPNEVLRECWRMLRPGGKIMLTTNLVGHMSAVYDAIKDDVPGGGVAGVVPRVFRRQSGPVMFRAQPRA